MYWPLLILIFLLGSSFGSAILCAAMRFADERVWWRGRSECDVCKKELAWDQLIPIVSFLGFRGKCKWCQTRLPWMYVMFEMMAGVAALIVAMRFFEFEDVWMLVRDVVIVGIALFALALDWYKMLVSVTLMIVGSVIIFFLPSSIDWVQMLIGAGVAIGFFGLQYLLTRGKGIGLGDIFLGLFMGVALGWPSVVIAIFLAYIFGAGHAIYLLSTKKAHRKSKLSLGMYLMIGLVATLAVQLLSLSIF